MTEHTTPTPAEVHAVLTLSLQNSKALKGTPAHRAGVIMDDLSDAGLCVALKPHAPASPTPAACVEPIRRIIHLDAEDFPACGVGEEPQKAGEPSHTTATRTHFLEWCAGTKSEPGADVCADCVALVSESELPAGPALKWESASSKNEAPISDRQYIAGVIMEGLEEADRRGWRRTTTILNHLAVAGLVVVSKSSIPQVVITENLNEPTTCTVDIDGVRRFSGADWTGHSINAQYLRDQLTDARMKLATAEGTIEHQRGRIQTLTDACQRKNSDCENYATQRRQAVEARQQADSKLAEHRRFWAPYSLALKRIESADVVQQVGTVVMLSGSKHHDLERAAASLEAEKDDHEVTRQALRDFREGARRGERIRQLMDLAQSVGAIVTVDGMRITPVDGVRTRATKP